MLFSQALEQTLHRALSLASARRQESATLEHLLLSLTDDAAAAAVLQACGVQLDKLRDNVSEFLDKELTELVTDARGEPKPTQAFRRVTQRAAKDARAYNHKEVTGADVLTALFSERQSHAVYFLQLQDMNRQDAVNFNRYGLTRTAGLPSEPLHVVDHPHKDALPPRLPAQGVGPHFEIDFEGVVRFPPPEALDRTGNHLERLRTMHPDLRDLACELAIGLGKGNAPHAVLGERVAAYAALIDRDLQAVDFRRLYTAGVRLANAAHATERAISIRDLPPLKLTEQEKLASLLALHGTFILSTAAGAEAIVDEERYRRRPAEERRYQADAIALATALQERPDLIEPDAAEQVLGAAMEVSRGYNVERSAVVGRVMLRNVMISIVSGAIGSATLIYAGPIMLGAGVAAAFVGTLAISETIKKTGWFQSLTRSMASAADGALDAPAREVANKFRNNLRRHRQFVTINEIKVRRLAGKREDFEFIHRALDWLKANAESLPHSEGSPKQQIGHQTENNS